MFKNPPNGLKGSVVILLPKKLPTGKKHEKASLVKRWVKRRLSAL